MGVSFKIAKVGSRYRPEIPLQPPDPVTTADASDETHEDPGVAKCDRKVNLFGLGAGFSDHSVYSANHEEPRASFSLNLFPNGFSVGKPTEGMLLPLIEDAPESLYPYDRASLTLFSAIEFGWLPGEIFDDMPCKYFNGTIACEVWDYRSCLSKLRNNDNADDEFPKVQKIHLRMGMENVVKDLPSILDDRSSYNDLLEVESRVTKALQPELFLSPDPFLVRLNSPFRKKLDLGICEGRLMRKQHDVPEINPHSTDVSYARDILRNGYFDSLKPWMDGGLGTFCYDQCTISVSLPIVWHDDIMANISKPALPVAFRTNHKPAPHHSSAIDNASDFVLAPDQNVKDCNSGQQGYAFLRQKRDRRELQLMREPSLKRRKQDAPVTSYFQHSFSQRGSLLEKKLQKNITPSEKHNGIETMMQSRFNNSNFLRSEMNGSMVGGVPKVQAQTRSLVCKGVHCCVKETLNKTNFFCKADSGTEKEDHDQGIERGESSQQQPLSFVCSLPPQMQCSSAVPSIEKFSNEITSRKRKSTEDPIVSTRVSVRSPVSNLGENLRMSSPAPCSTRKNVANIGCHVDKAALAPLVSAVNVFVGSSIINSSVRENQTPWDAKKTSRCRWKTSMNKVGTGFSITGINNAQICSNSPSKGSTFVQPLSVCKGDLPVRERFLKIVAVATSHGLSKDKDTADENLKSKSTCHLPLTPMMDLLMPEEVEECRSLMDNMCLAKFLVGGNRNISKIRIMTFVRIRYLFRENTYPLAAFDSWKLVLFESERADDHEVGVELIFGEVVRVPISVLPSSHLADLFAAQFISLMEHDGYELRSDNIQPIYRRFTNVSSGNSVQISFCSNSELSFASSEAVCSPKQVTSRGPLHPLSPQYVRTPTIDSPACSNLTRPKQLEMFDHLNSMQLHCSHNQRSMLSVWDNFFGNSHMQMSGQLLNSPISPHHFQWQQYQDQHNQQQKIFLSEMFGLEATDNGSCMGAHMTGLTVPHIADNLGQISEFCQSGVKFINEGNSQVQATPTAKPGQASIEGTGVMDVKTLLDYPQGSGHIGQFQGMENICVGPSKHLNFKYYGYPKQVHVQQQDKKPDIPWKRQEPVSLPLQDGTPNLALMSKSTTVSLSELSSGSSSHQVNAVPANELSHYLALKWMHLPVESLVLLWKLVVGELSPLFWRRVVVS